MDEKMKELIIDYVDGNLSGELAEYVQKQIDKHAEIAEEYNKLLELSSMMESAASYEPDSVVKHDFLLAIEEELDKESAKSDNVRVLSWDMSWKVAATVALLAISLFIGQRVFNDGSEATELAQLKQEMAETKSLVLSSLENTTSASTRLNGIHVAYANSSVDGEIIRVLIKTMNEDENVNVRLAAVRALAKFSKEPGVVPALVSSLENQSEALVQIALINLMVEFQEKGALENIQQIIDDEKTLEAVKDEAHMAVFKLS